MRLCRSTILMMLVPFYVADARAQQDRTAAPRRAGQDAAETASASPRNPANDERNAVYDRYSWINLGPVPERTFKIGDLLTIIIREHREFRADADLRTRKRLDLESELDAFLKLTDGGVGGATFSRGRPTIDYRYNNRLQTDADTEREDRLITRVTAKIIDVKPNGLLVLEARARIEHDDEISAMAFTGTCRKQDVTADNTVLSTQVADKTISVHNEGAVRANTSRGWLLKLLDMFRPF